MMFVDLFFIIFRLRKSTAIPLDRWEPLHQSKVVQNKRKRSPIALLAFHWNLIASHCLCVCFYYGNALLLFFIVFLFAQFSFFSFFFWWTRFFSTRFFFDCWPAAFLDFPTKIFKKAPFFLEEKKTKDERKVFFLLILEMKVFMKKVRCDESECAFCAFSFRFLRPESHFFKKKSKWNDFYRVFTEWNGADENVTTEREREIKKNLFFSFFLL